MGCVEEEVRRTRMFGMLAISASVGVLTIGEVWVLNFICGKTGVLTTAASVSYLR
jgi:hypothetical protein